MRYHVVFAESQPQSLFEAGIIFPRAYHYSAESKARVAKLALLNITARSEAMWLQQAKMQAASFATVKRARFTVSGASALEAAAIARLSEFVLDSNADVGQIVVALEGVDPQDFPATMKSMSGGKIELIARAF